MIDYLTGGLSVLSLFAALVWRHRSRRKQAKQAFLRQRLFGDNE